MASANGSRMEGEAIAANSGDTVTEPRLAQPLAIGDRRRVAA